jgi:iron(III) transport system ATP-binding protein
MRDVTVTGLHKAFGTHQVLTGVDLEVPTGSLTAILGPSGSGKTTLLRMLAGFERADAGSIRIGDRLVDGPGTYLVPERRRIGYVPQDGSLFPHLTVEANVGFGLPARQRRGARTAGLLETVGLGGLGRRYPHQLSGGQQQRVALARALAARPAVLLCDEPLSHLDADLRERLRTEIATLARENDTTVLYITHDQGEAFALADQIGVLQSGQLVQCGLPETIYHTPATPFVARFTGVAGELHGRVVGPRDAAGWVRVDTPSGPVLASEPAKGQPGSVVTVLVRPAAAWLADDGGLRGQVEDIAYRGHGYDHLVRLADGTRLAGVFAAERRERGEEVHVGLDPAGCFAYPAGAGDPAER